MKKFEVWFIQNNKGEDCSCAFTEYDRAVMWKQYLSDCNPHNGPYLLYGFLLNEQGKMA